jgi:hypothetical protein
MVMVDGGGGGSGGNVKMTRTPRVWTRWWKKEKVPF